MGCRFKICCGFLRRVLHRSGPRKSVNSRLPALLIEEETLIVADGYGFDYVMVFKAERGGHVTEVASKTVRQIIAAGLTARVYFSAGKEEIFCEIRATPERLMQFADQTNRRLLLDREELQRATEAGNPEAHIAPIKINDDLSISFRSPFEYIYARYDRRSSLQSLYSKSNGLWHPFRTVVRLGLVADILKTPLRLGGAGLKVDKMKLDGDIVAFFPKHFKKNKLRLRQQWLVMKQWPWEAPYDNIKDYYGEKVGLYFQFLGHLTTWLIPLAAAGLATALAVYITGNEEHPMTLVFAPIVVLWAIAMLEFWKRKEKRIALEWGMIDFEKSEQTRPEYKGEFIRSPVDGRIVLYYPPGKRVWKTRRATGVIVTMTLVVISCIAAVYAFRWYLVYGTSGDWGKTWGGVIASIINSVQIQILNIIYKRIAVSLTDFENHRTATEYEDGLVMKLFCFTFCNSYGGFIYLAFIGEPVVGIACERSCMQLLATNLTIVFGVQLLVGNLTEVLIPYFKYRMRERAEQRVLRANPKDRSLLRTQAEKGYMLEPYDPVMGTLMDYAELAVQFGYITLFVVAFPLAPFLALGNNYVEARSDAFKLLTQMQRPIPRGAEDIGCWQSVFTVLTCIAVLTNSALICLIYEDIVGEYSLSTRLWLFILFQWVAYIFMALLEVSVPDVPEDVKLQLQRTAFLSSKVIDQVRDDSDDDVRQVEDKDLEKIKVEITPAASPSSNDRYRPDTML